MVNIWQLVSYGLWTAFATGPGNFIYGVMLRVLGREDYGRYIAGMLSAMLVMAFSWSLVQVLYGRAVLLVPYGLVFYVISDTLLVALSSTG